MKDLTNLRKIAENATPGPWLLDGFDQVVRTPGRGIVHDDSCAGSEEWLANTDAPFIATFDPPTVLALITRLEQAERAVARVREVLEHHTFVADDKYGDLAASQYYGDSELEAVAAISITRALDGGQDV